MDGCSLGPTGVQKRLFKHLWYISATILVIGKHVPKNCSAIKKELSYWGRLQQYSLK